jgi:hypothetical protein
MIDETGKPPKIEKSFQGKLYNELTEDVTLIFRNGTKGTGKIASFQWEDRRGVVLTIQQVEELV